MIKDIIFGRRSMRMGLNHALMCARALRKPILIVHRGDPKQTVYLRKHFQSEEQLVYVPLGYACPMDRLYEEVFFQLAPHSTLPRSYYHKKNISTVAEKMRQSKIEFTVIDNCQHIVINQLFYLLGLIFELEAVHFVFVIEKRYYDRWRQSTGINELRSQYFMDHLGKRIWLE